MATLRKLIKNQSLTLDTRQAGDGQAVRSDDLHMEKQLHAKPYGEIRSSFSGNRESALTLMPLYSAGSGGSGGHSAPALPGT
jgi:hypothetical protein